MNRWTDHALQRFRRWSKNHKVEAVIVCSAGALVVLTAIGMAFVEPYQRVMFVAMLPSQLLMGLFQAIIFAGIYSFMFRGAGLPFTGSQVKSEAVNVPLSAVIGLSHVKQEVAEVIGFLKDHARLSSAGGRMISGILFTGDPGTGKTLMAKAIATECGLPFISISGAGFVEVFVGVGASRVRQLFTKARELAEESGGCVIFIDEFDALGKAREYTPYGSMEDNRTVNQLLEKMDGVADENRNILVIAATNAGIETLDAAVTRPGRFDRHIHFNKPGYEDRLEMLVYFCKGKRVAADADLPGLARSLAGSSGADIENLVNEAVLIALRRNEAKVDDGDFGAALARLRLGVERCLTQSLEERRAIAVHESGHAMADRLFGHDTSIYRVSIIPRGGSLGATWSDDTAEKHLHTASELEGRLRVLLAGYAAERVVLGESTDGVTSDFKQATDLARNMVLRLGMGDSLGYFSDGGALSAGLSEEFRAELDKGVQEKLTKALADVETAFKRPNVRKQLDALAQALLARDELDAASVDLVLAEAAS